MARRSKYDPETFPGLAEGWAREGLTDEQIARKLGVSPRTFYAYEKKYPRFLHAIKAGKAPVDFEVESALLKRALGYETTEELKETQIGPTGSETERKREVKRFVPPDVTACIFWLKNRKPKQWREKQEIEQHSGTLADFLARAGSLSDEEQKTVDEYYKRYSPLGMREPGWWERHTKGKDDGNGGEPEEGRE